MIEKAGEVKGTVRDVVDRLDGVDGVDDEVVIQ